MVKLTKKEWDPIWGCIKSEYPLSVWLIRDKLKETLGFSVRTHHDPYIDKNGWEQQSSVICLDFYDEQMEIMFRLKYL